MPRVRNNVFIHGLSGTLGDQLTIKKDRGGRTIVTNKPVFDENRKFTPAQKSHQGKFQEAIAYAKSAKGEAIYIELARGTPKCSYNVAIADWFHPPEILELDLSRWSGEAGQLIRIKARDDVRVTQVTVMICAETGEIFEQGEAVRAEELWWEYTTTSATSTNARVEAAARDMPGNVTKFAGAR